MKYILLTFLFVSSVLGFSQVNTTFYSLSKGSQHISDSSHAFAIRFKLATSNHELMAEAWEDALDDLDYEDDVNVEHHMTLFGCSFASIPNATFDLYSRWVDLHDSSIVMFSFRQDSAFISQSEWSQHPELDRVAKSLIFTMYNQYKQEELDAKKELVDDARDYLEEVRDDISDTEEKVLDAQRSIERKKTDISVNRETVRGLVDEIGQKRATFARTPAEQEETREDLEDEIKRLERRRESAEDDIEDWNEDIFDLEEKISDWNFQLSTLRNDLDNAENELNRARRAYEDLRAEMASYRMDPQ